MLADSYQQCCESRGIAPHEGVVAMECSSLSLPGNTFDRFTKRVTDEDVAAIVEAISVSGSTFMDVLLPYNSITSLGGKCVAAAISFSGCLNNITSLDLSFNSLGSEAGVALSGALRENTTLIELRLAGNPLGAEGGGSAFGYALAAALAKNRSLCRLDLYSTDLDMHALVPIAGSLAENKGLVSLNIGKPLLPSPNDVRYVVHHLSLSLPDNSCLRSLDLSYFDLYDEHLQHLFPALCASGLTSLVLRANKLSQDTGLLVARLLDRREDFAGLDLSANCIGDVGAAHLAPSLAAHPRLQALSLASAGMGAGGIAALAPAIAKCRALQSLALWGNDLRGEAAEELYAISDRIDCLESVDFAFQVVDGVPAVYKT